MTDTINEGEDAQSPGGGEAAGSSPPPASPQERLAEIRKERISTAVWTMFSMLLTTELLFSSFAIGAAFGPGPLKLFEVFLGVSGALVVAVVASIPVIRRRLERGAQLIATVQEGRRKIRALFFDDHFMLGPEIVLRPMVTTVELEKDALVIRYQDANYGGVVLRELGGDPETRARIAAMLKPPPNA
jgi:hypothetical protein